MLALFIFHAVPSGGKSKDAVVHLHNDAHSTCTFLRHVKNALPTTYGIGWQIFYLKGFYIVVSVTRWLDNFSIFGHLQELKIAIIA